MFIHSFCFDYTEPMKGARLLKGTEDGRMQCAPPGGSETRCERSQGVGRSIGAIVIAAIRIYQKTRILRAPSCRFYPSCSEYMARSIEAHGPLHGIVAGIGRLCKCHPFHPGGVDDVAVKAPLSATQRNKDN